MCANSFFLPSLRKWRVALPSDQGFLLLPWPHEEHRSSSFGGSLSHPPPPKPECSILSNPSCRTVGIFWGEQKKTTLKTSQRACFLAISHKTHQTPERVISTRRHGGSTRERSGLQRVPHAGLHREVTKVLGGGGSWSPPSFFEKGSHTPLPSTPPLYSSRSHAFFKWKWMGWGRVAGKRKAAGWLPANREPARSCSELYGIDVSPPRPGVGGGWGSPWALGNLVPHTYKAILSHFVWPVAFLATVRGSLASNCSSIKDPDPDTLLVPRKRDPPHRPGGRLHVRSAEGDRPCLEWDHLHRGPISLFW